MYLTFYNGCPMPLSTTL